MAKFTTRHYEMLAKAMQDAQQHCAMNEVAHAGYKMAEEALTATLCRDNPAFDSYRFVKACEPTANVKARSNMGARS